MEDAALALAWPAVVVEGGEASEARGLAAAEGAELRDGSQEEPTGAVGDALDLAEAGDLGSEEFVGTDQGGDLGLKGIAVGSKGLGEALGHPDDERVAVMLGTVVLLNDKADDLLATANQLGEALGGGGGLWGERRVDDAAILGEDGGVESVGLGQEALGAGEVADAARVEEAEGDLGGMEGGREVVLIAAGGLAEDVDGARDAVEKSAESLEACGIVAEDAAWDPGVRTEVEGVFGDIDADVGRGEGWGFGVGGGGVHGDSAL
jgi:hypothetical protein